MTLSKDLTVETLREHLKSQKVIVNVTPAFDWAGSRHLVGTSLVFKAKTAESGVRLLKQFRAQIQDVEKVALSSNKLIFINVNPWPRLISHRIGTDCHPAQTSAGDKNMQRRSLIATTAALLAGPLAMAPGGTWSLKGSMSCPKR